MIISIRGPSGSGKSTLVRRLTSALPPGLPIHTDGRKKPTHTIYPLPMGSLAVLGHYEIANGGIDTFRDSLADVYSWAVKLSGKHHVLMEGKCLSDGTRQIEYHGPHRFRVVVLNTSLKECIASVRSRGHNIAERSVEKAHVKVQRDATALRVIGAEVFIGDRDECFDKVKEYLTL